MWMSGARQPLHPKQQFGCGGPSRCRSSHYFRHASPSLFGCGPIRRLRSTPQHEWIDLGLRSDTHITHCGRIGDCTLTNHQHVSTAFAPSNCRYIVEASPTSGPPYLNSLCAFYNILKNFWLLNPTLYSATTSHYEQLGLPKCLFSVSFTLCSHDDDPSSHHSTTNFIVGTMFGCHNTMWNDLRKTNLVPVSLPLRRKTSQGYGLEHLVQEGQGVQQLLRRFSVTEICLLRAEGFEVT